MPSSDILKTSSDIEQVDKWTAGAGAACSAQTYSNVVRFGSSSSQASQSSGDICRICHCESDPQNPLLTPCYCSGSLKYVHQACLQQWLTASETNSCELCKFPFIMHTKIKPFNEWRSLDMSGVERRRLCCAVLFHCAAALCVIWSLCVLIERAAEEVKRGLIGWPFWTKLAVVTVGLTGGVVFMYIQCRQYLHLCHRWRARNRILLIQNAPEKIHPLSNPSPTLQNRTNIPRNNSSTVSNAPGCAALNNPSMMNPNGYNSSYNSQYGYYPPNYSAHQNSASIQQPHHIVANIETQQDFADRDWQMDELSQISSFRPCAQGSGSMTPFHDSVQNVLNEETSINCANDNIDDNTSNSSKLSSSHNANSASIKGANQTHYPNSSVFLENRDILNDSTEYYQSMTAPTKKLQYRHSAALLEPTDLTVKLDKALGKDLRRYSDTKLLQEYSDDPNSTDSPDTVNHVTSSDEKYFSNTVPVYSTNSNNTTLTNSSTANNSAAIDLLNPIFNVALNSNPMGQCSDEFRGRIHYKPRNVTSSNILSSGEQKLMHNILGGSPQITDILFESATQIDPLELNIQEILDMDFNLNKQLYSTNSSRRKMRRSLNAVENFSAAIANDTCDPCSAEYLNEKTKIDLTDRRRDNTSDTQIDKSRIFFKSLPNLSSSCESLIKK